MNSLLDSLAGILLTQSLQVGVIFLIVMMACILLRRASSHWRYLLWLLVVAKCLTPPIVSFSLPVLPGEQIVDARSSYPGQTIEIEDWSFVPSSESTMATATEGISSASLESGVIDRQPAAKAKLITLSLQHWLAIAWVTGAFAFLLTMAIKIWTTHRTIIRSRVEADEKVQSILHDLARTLGLKRLPKLYEVDFAVQPFVWGWLGGDIYLSPSFSTSCSREKCRSMIAHELAHVSRWDAAVNHLQNVVQALFFFHPMVWIANKRLRLERERCCDEAVLSDSANSPRVYAEAIIDMLTRESESGKSTPALAVTGALMDIKVRLVTILTPNRNFFRRPSRTAVITMLLLGACVLPTVVVLTRSSMAMDDRNNNGNSVELKRFYSRFVDEAGNAIQGVQVTAAGVRCKEDPFSGYGWPTNVAPKIDYVTDANGEVEVEYPSNFPFGFGQELTPTVLIFRCKHEQYMFLGNVEVGVAVKNFTQTLERGCQVTLTCRGPDGLPIIEFANVRPGWDREIWKLRDGHLRNGSLSVGDTQTMLVVPDANGKHLFSEPINLHGSKENEFTSEIEVQPGMSLSGKLADNVPRPIKLGKVIAFCVPKPLGPSFTENPAVSWMDEATISPDGSFEFASLPPSESVQLIALCRGWLTDQWGEDMNVKGQILNIDQDQMASKKISGITLTMEQAGAIDVAILDPEGNPVVGAEVSCWPNQAYSHNLGTSLLGFCYKSIELVNSQIAGRPAPVADPTKSDRFIALTDKEGKAVLYEIPLNRQQFVQAFHKEFELRDNSTTEFVRYFRGLEFKCDTPEPKKITVHMTRPRKASDTKIATAAPKNGKAKMTAPPASNSKVVKFEVELLSQEQVAKSIQDRPVAISATIRKAMIDYSEGIQEPSPQIETTVNDLRNGKETLTLENVLSLFVPGDEAAVEVAKHLLQNDDPVIQFAGNLIIASSVSGDPTVAQNLHKLAHDKSLSMADRQLICTWCGGVGIRPDDSVEQIRQHFANVSAEEVKFKPGDVAPEFEFESETGAKISSKEMQEKRWSFTSGQHHAVRVWARCLPMSRRLPSWIKVRSKLSLSALTTTMQSLLRLLRNFKYPSSTCAMSVDGEAI